MPVRRGSTHENPGRFAPEEAGIDGIFFDGFGGCGGGNRLQ